MMDDQTTCTFGPARFRHVLGHFPTGVVVVTTVADKPVGVVIGSFTAASLDPPLVGFLIGRESTTWPKLRTTGFFAVNVLADEQQDICRTFSTPNTDRFANVRWRPAATGAPILDGTVAWIDCVTDSIIQAGDHYFVLGRVIELDADATAEPLVFLRGGYGRITV